jgi:hypothetical protein
VAAADWQTIRADHWVARAVTPPCYVCPTTCLVLRWLTPQQKAKQAIIVCSITDWTMSEVVAHYDDRGTCETEIQADKGGLSLERRRKKRLAAQEAIVLLNDVAHNLLSWVSQWMFTHDPLLGSFGSTRLVEDVFQLPGRLRFSDERLVEAQLNRLHPHAEAVAADLERLLIPNPFV